nr:hypothetical protein [Tanacetum cinerariifolium]GEY79448.1 hypothetical protein [Tanacetum cinerariifolium]
MSEQAELNLSPPMSAMRNTVRKGKEQTSKNSYRSASNAALREYCDTYYRCLLPIISEKVHQEKVQQEKLKDVKARLNFEGDDGLAAPVACPKANAVVIGLQQEFLHLPRHST